ncbi:nucleoside-diphosphate-sugar epimerase [Neorhizobium galegae]|uniref:NAD-dependent epimerase/dehydratase family protein n=1 Tax=Neorhizobium galegae TaxID=399 RepID=UPI001AEB1846|nr:NAD(P)-dependent oxidoreductase [Neorhizobium galegae]MBP2551426.1 nucleoside-diphosphate-sugar epimerase [Neorhizobium galegae]
MAPKSKAVFVTGATGFIGRRVVAALLKAGRKVIATDVVSPRGSDLGCPFYVADVRDITRHAPVVAEGCESIVHCGGISGPMLLQDNAAEVIDINVRGTAQLLSLASDLKLRRFVSLSSVSAYGDTPEFELVDENVRLSASTFYGTSKAASDLVLQSFVRERGLSAIALRIGWVYGPGRVTDAIIQPLVRSAKGEPLQLEAGAQQRLQFVHVDDVVSAIHAALDAVAPTVAAYNINGSETVTVGDIFDLVARQLPTIRAQIGPGLLPGADQQGKMLLNAAARDLGWKPEISFPEGLRAYVSWLQENPY